MLGAFVINYAPAPSVQGDGEAMRVSLEPTLIAAGVNAVFAGHVHAYERSFPVDNNTVVPAGQGGIVHFNIGDAGASLYTTWLPVRPWEGGNVMRPAVEPFLVSPAQRADTRVVGLPLGDVRPRRVFDYEPHARAVHGAYMRCSFAQQTSGSSVPALSRVFAKPIPWHLCSGTKTRTLSLSSRTRFTLSTATSKICNSVAA